MQLQVNYRQIALERIQDLLTLSHMDGNFEPVTTEEIWIVKILIATLVLLMWWAILED